MRRGIYSSCARRGVSLFRAGRCALSVARECLFQHTAFMSDLLLNRREVLRKESQRHKWLSAMYAVRKCTLAGNHLRPILESFLHVKDGRLPSMFACAVFVVSKNHVSSSVCVLLRTTTSLYPRSFHGAYSGEVDAIGERIPTQRAPRAKDSWLHCLLDCSTSQVLFGFALHFILFIFY